MNQADWEAVAADNGHKDGSISKTRWGQIRRKKIEGIVPVPKSGTPKKSPKKRAGPKAEDELDVDDAATPSKSKKARTKAEPEKEIAVKEDAVMDDADEESVLKQEDESTGQDAEGLGKDGAESKDEPTGEPAVF